MATGGWGGSGAGGAWGGGAWGSGYQKPTECTEDIDLGSGTTSGPRYPASTAAPAPPPTFGGNGQGPASFARPATFREAQPAPAYTTTQEAPSVAPVEVIDERTKILGSSSTQGSTPRKNWPICWPWFYHDIGEEVPAGYPRRVVRMAYATWWALVACMLWNFVCASFILGESKAQYKWGSWFLAMTYAVTGIPLSFLFWYRPLYNSCKNNSTVGMLLFFAVFAVHLCFCLWATIAFPFRAEYWSLAGWGTAMKAADLSALCGTVYYICAAMWTLEFLVSCWVLKESYQYFKGRR